jgi:hypothetical protein
VRIVIAVDHTFLPLNAGGDVRHDWQSPEAATSRVQHDTALMG